MKIVHFAPFAPNACGLYEAARDMIVADLQAGHESYLVDVGVTSNGVHTPGEIGKEDVRGYRKITTMDPVVARTADILIAHTGVPDPWFSVCQAPLIWILHGRPAACFKPEQFKRGHSYTLMADLASWPRIKAMVSFWPFHTKFWQNIISNGKLICFPAPPVDQERFSSKGKTHDFGDNKGKWNVALADSWREDIDLFDITNGVIEFARNNHDVKFHFYGMETPLGCWEFLLTELRNLGALGEVWARRPDIEEIYRASDIVLSPHRITTRIIGEALSCGTPVIAANGCEFATWTCDSNNPEDVASTIKVAINQLGKSETVTKRVRQAAEKFSLDNYNKHMKVVYEGIV